MTGVQFIVLWTILGSYVPSTIAQTNFDILKQCHIALNECPNKNVSFYLYTRELGDRPHQLDVSDNTTIDNAPFVDNRPVIVLLHGYTGHRDFSPNIEIRPAYLRTGDYNIVSVDYKPLVPEPCYVQAVINLPVAARCTAQMLDTVVQRRNVALDSVHIIGFSLGAQVAGMISKYIRSGNLTRITGLDPARPLFVLAAEDHRLSWNDAEFVDVIHTDVLQRGMLLPVGHADFYVNGGIEQPGCKYSTTESLGSCNHARAPQYYAESIMSADGFWGFQCRNYIYYAMGMCKPATSKELAIMGIRASTEARGLYFVYTNKEPPYAKGILPEFEIDGFTIENITQTVLE